MIEGTGHQPRAEVPVGGGSEPGAGRGSVGQAFSGDGVALGGEDADHEDPNHRTLAPALHSPRIPVLSSWAFRVSRQFMRQFMAWASVRASSRKSTSTLCPSITLVTRPSPNFL